jgi:adenosylcobinamide amidohydrolase
MTGQAPRLVSYEEAGRAWPALVWCAPPRFRGISSAVIGGGIGPVTGWVNAMVDKDYAEPDPVSHVRVLAAQLGLSGPRVVGMITAADVRHWTAAEDGGVSVAATVGLGVPTRAAAPDGDGGVGGGGGDGGDGGRPRVGTINLLVVVPAPLADAALVNAVITATEAKTQALAECGYVATGTASDAVCVVCPDTSGEAADVLGPADPYAGSADPYAGPRSLWGARVARAVHRAVLDGTQNWQAQAS